MMSLPCALVTLTLLAMCQRASCTYSPYNTYYVIKQLERRLYSLERQSAASLVRLGDIEDTVNALAKQQCQTNKVFIETCPGFLEADVGAIAACVTSPAMFDGPVTTDVAVPFNPPFLNTPIVDATLSGQALLIGKNCSIEITSVSSAGFMFTYTADNLLPLAVEIQWYACPGAVFTANQKLPFGPAPVLTHSQFQSGKK